jgi:hypothetical protein
MAIAFSAVGMLTLIPSLQALARHVIRLSSGAYRFSDLWASADWQANFWSSIIGVAASIWLIFGSRGVARVVIWARAAAAKRGDESTET